MDPCPICGRENARRHLHGTFKNNTYSLFQIDITRYVIGMDVFKVSMDETGFAPNSRCHVKYLPFEVSEWRNNDNLNEHVIPYRCCD